MIELQVYVADGCWACEETRRIITEVRPRFPDIRIELIDVTDQYLPANVFAVPTYLLNGRTLYLGNPTVQELRRTLANARSAEWL